MKSIILNLINYTMRKLSNIVIYFLINQAKEKYDGECIKLSGLIASKQSARGKELERVITNVYINRTRIE